MAVSVYSFGRSAILIRGRAAAGSVSPKRQTSNLTTASSSWEDHLSPLCKEFWLKNTRTYHVQSWLDEIGKCGLSRNTLKHIKSVVSGMFTLAKQQNYFDGINPAQDTAINPNAAEPEETYAYSLEEFKPFLRCSRNQPLRRLR